MFASSLVKFNLLGLVFHVVYLFSIFDIYFRSPLIHGMSQYETEGKAERLVLFVADGLRADRIFDINPILPTETFPTIRAPFLQKIASSVGSWGVSHTRVPTESRPGHVAIIAGFYEDISAVTKGWKINPVEFDSFFNQSRHTWSFGSPDILPMFKLGASDSSKIETFMYDAEEENFNADSSHLDTWVFEKFESLFEEARRNATLNMELRKEKNVFFLHLLGLDSNGHTFRPHSKEYLNNIAVVDQGIEKVTKIINDFYKDDNTAFIFSADHGMSNIGNHGDGNPDNTKTPLVAWGRGINSSISMQDNEFYWASSKRKDVKQGDIAPLMATLLGVPIPMNSVGILPIEYLQGSEEYKAKSLYVNAQQILAQFLKKSELKKNSEPFFSPYDPLTNSKSHYHLMKGEIENFLEKGNFAEAQSLSMKLIETSLDGLRYFQT
jgi:phosphatidylinositol glycan class N